MNLMFSLKRLARDGIEEWRMLPCLLTIPLLWGAGMTFDALKDTWLMPLLNTSTPTHLWHVLCGTLVISIFALYHRRYAKKMGLLFYNSLQKADRDFLQTIKKGDVQKNKVSCN